MNAFKRSVWLLILIPTVGATAEHTVSWQAPTENVDGTQIPQAGTLALSHFTIKWGIEQGVYPFTIHIEDAAQREHTFETLPSKIYVAMTATNNAGDESADSNVVKKGTPAHPTFTVQ